MKWNKATLAMLGLLLFCGGIAFALTPQSESFDKPLRTKVVNFGHSKYLRPNSPSQVELTCFYFESFVVKQFVNPGLKGSRLVTMVPVAGGKVLPCQVKHDPAERSVTEDGWYFVGAKSDLLFIQASEGDENSGMPFRVVSAKTNEKVFEDSSYFYRQTHIRFTHTADGTLALKYLRAVGGDCSIAKDGASCWSKFRKHYGVVSTATPVCEGYQREGAKEWKIGDPGVPPEVMDVPSAIAYPVSVVILPQPRITPIAGAVKCGPQQ